jgi:hypothetical protein
MKKTFLLVIIIFLCFKSFAASILINMDEEQRNHLKAYGIAFYALQKGITVDWLLNYKGD